MAKPEVIARNPASREVAPMTLHIHLASAQALPALNAAARPPAPQPLPTPEFRSKESVNYRLGSGEDNCGACRYGRFMVGSVSGNCTKVAGEIRQAYLCDLFASKTRDLHGR